MSQPKIFDRHLLRVRQRAPARVGAETFLIDRVADELGERLAVVLRQFERAVDLGTPTDAVRRVLAASGKVGTIVAPCRRRPRDAPLRVAADEEALPFADGSLDLVVSALALQFVNDLPGTLIQIRRALKPDGLLLAALIGGDTLDRTARRPSPQAESEIEGGVSPRVAPFADLRDLGALLQRAGFALPVTDVDRAHRALRLAARADARPAPHGRDQRADRAPPHAAQARDAAPDGRNLRRALRRSPTAACARPSRSSGCRAGRRMRASSSRSSRARPGSGSPMRCGTTEISAGEKAGR